MPRVLLSKNHIEVPWHNIVTGLGSTLRNLDTHRAMKEHTYWLREKKSHVNSSGYILPITSYTKTKYIAITKRKTRVKYVHEQNSTGIQIYWY